MPIEKHLRCPNCCSGYRMLVESHDGTIKCLTCGQKFSLFGIKFAYPRLPLPLKLKSWIQLVRPFTLLPALVAGVIGGSLPLISQGLGITEHFFTLIFVGVTLALFQAVGQIVNQVTDADMDFISKPYRPIPSKRVSKGEAMSMGWILALFGIARSFTVSVTFGLLGLSILFFAIFYNLEPRMKKFTWGGNVWLGISRGFLPFVASWSVFGCLTSVTPYILGSFAFLWVLGLNPTKDFPDVKADNTFNIQTLPVRYGEKKARRIMFGMSFLPFVFLFPIILLDPRFIPLFFLILFTPGIWYGLERTSPVENSYAWVLFYAGLSLIYLVALTIV